MQYSFSIANLLLGASESIDLIAITGAGFIKALETIDMFALADQRLRLRAVLTDPTLWAPGIGDLSRVRHQIYAQQIKRMQEWGWEVRIVHRTPTSSCFIIDDQIALVEDLTNPDEVYDYQKVNEVIRDARSVKALGDHFGRLWSEGQHTTIMYEDLLLSSVPRVTSAIVTESKERWASLITYFAEHPEKMRGFDPRGFEELIAELLTREDMTVELTQPSKDGGRDILATANTSLGKHLYLIECKRYARENKVGISIVRALYGVVEAEKATRGILVTTSDFTRGASEFGKVVENRLELMGYDSLTQWVKRHAAFK